MVFAIFDDDKGEERTSTHNIRPRKNLSRIFSRKHYSRPVSAWFQAEAGRYCRNAWTSTTPACEASKLLEVEGFVADEYYVSEREEKLYIHQPSLSQQLGVLREAGLVATRRDAKQIYYRLTEEKVAELIEALHGIFCKKDNQK